MVLAGLLITLLFAGISPVSADPEGSTLPPSRNPDLKDFDASYKTRGEPIIEILTIEPGNQIHNIWGHTGLHVYDPRIGKDMVFDYGIFRFGIDFGWRFLMGNPAYWLGVREWDTVVKRFSQENRTMYVQRVNLTDEEKTRLIQFLYRNALPSNRHYQYHHFEDNCTTRIRDAISKSTGGKLVDALATPELHTTYRTKSMEAARPFVVSYLMLNLLLNSGADYTLSGPQEVFLPLLFMDRLAKLNIKSDFPDGRPLIDGARVVYRSRNTGRLDEMTSWTIFFALLITYMVVFHILPGLFPSIPLSSLAGKIGIWTWSLLAGGVGFILSFLWIVSPRVIFSWNLNLMAFHPFLLLLPALLLVKSISSKTKQMILVLFFVIPLLGIGIELAGLIHQEALQFLIFASIMQGIHLTHYLAGRGPFVSQD